MLGCKVDGTADAELMLVFNTSRAATVRKAKCAEDKSIYGKILKNNNLRGKHSIGNWYMEHNNSLLSCLHLERVTIHNFLLFFLDKFQTICI